jgi:hypothetical protein
LVNNQPLKATDVFGQIGGRLRRHKVRMPLFAPGGYRSAYKPFPRSVCFMALTVKEQGDEAVRLHHPGGLANR